MRKKPEVSLRTRALQYMARREFSRAELRGKLLAHVRAGEYPDQSQPAELLDVLLDDLTARGWLSDERAATQLIHAKRSRFGMQRIAHELRRKGITENLIGDALPQLKETELAAAHEVWQKKFGKHPRDAKEKAKQARFLQSRGFSMDAIIKVIKIAGSDKGL